MIYLIYDRRPCYAKYGYGSYLGIANDVDADQCSRLNLPGSGLLPNIGLASTHIKGRLLDQAVIVFNCVPFHNGNFKDRICSQRERILSFKSIR